MRISPKQLLQSLLYLTPITLLALASCGGGGGGGSSTPAIATYTISGAASGVHATGLVLRNNGGDDLQVASGVASYHFATKLAAYSTYNVTVLKHPSSPVEHCTVAAASGVVTGNVTNANVSCVPAFTIIGSVSGIPATAVVLQADGADNTFVAASGVVAPFTFATPIVDGPHTISVLSQPNGQDCTFTSAGTGTSGTSGLTTGTFTFTSSGNVTGVTIGCATNTATPDRFVYTANHGSTGLDGLTAFTTSSGALTLPQPAVAETNPSAIAVGPDGQFAYETNFGANNVRVYSTTTPTGSLTEVDADGSITGTQAAVTTGTGPVAVAIHPSGKFAYVLNQGSNSISGYSIDPASGALSRIDLNGTALGTTIPTRNGPISIAITHNGNYVYVVNQIEASCLAITGCGHISYYHIDTSTGLLTPAGTIEAGKTPYSIAIGPGDQYAYVANGGSGTVGVYSIASGTLTYLSTTVPAGDTPRAVTVDPSGQFVYVVNGGSADISAYNISGSSLTQIACSGNGSGQICSLTPGYTSNFATGLNTSNTKPIAISIDSSGSYAYVANSGESTVTVLQIGSGSGANGAKLIHPTDYSTGANPYSVTTAR